MKWFFPSRSRWLLAVPVLVLVVGGGSPVQAQFFCRVSVDYSQLSGARYTYLDELATDVQAYFNRRAWTVDRYQQFERIECSLQIIFQEAVTLTSFSARLILTSSRPIYGTAQTTRVLQINDTDWQFDYAQGTPLVFEPETFNALTSVLDFYAYVMLGYDYDTFSELGGTEYFNRARRLAELAQSRGGIGWTQLGTDRNRATLISELMDPRFQTLRRAFFIYHFEGLDKFLSQTDKARSAVLDVLADLQVFYQEVSRNYPLDLFFSSKYQELAAIFEDSSLSSQAYTVLRELDASHLSTYETLVQ